MNKMIKDTHAHILHICIMNKTVWLVYKGVTKEQGIFLGEEISKFMREFGGVWDGDEALVAKWLVLMSIRYCLKFLI